MFCVRGVIIEIDCEIHVTEISIKKSAETIITVPS